MEKELSIEIVFPSREDVLLNNLSFRFNQNKDFSIENEHTEKNEWMQEYEIIYGSYLLEL